MKKASQRGIRSGFLFAITTALALCAGTGALAQGTAFTYQGQLDDGGHAADGSYDMQFKVWTASAGGSQVGSTQTAIGMPVEGGLFALELDFGSGIFTGADRWLEIGVQTNGGGGFATLVPRTRFTSTPYAIAALSAQAAASDPANSISSSEVVNNSLTSSDLGPNSVGSSEVVDNSLTADDLQAGSVGASEIASGAVGASEIGSWAISDGHIHADAAILGDKIVGGDLKAGRLKTGQGHTLFGSMATIAGGEANTANGTAAAIGGGKNNRANGSHGAVGGGFANLADGAYAAMGGGNMNRADGESSVVGGGQENSAGWIYSTVGGGWSNKADRSSATVGGGAMNVASGSSAVVGGGHLNTASGFEAHVGGGRENAAVGSFSSVAGGKENSASGDNATVGGGERNEALYYATIGGGIGNVAAGTCSFIGGGSANVASNDYTTVGGGVWNEATRNAAVVGGGWDNQATNSFATVPGGTGNAAGGICSFAAGNYAKALHEGSFVWADYQSVPFYSTANNEFAARTTGGVRFITAVDGTGTPTLTVYLPAGGLAWSWTSDRNLKENFRPIDPVEILQKVADLPVSEWNVVSQDPGIRHVGPMAQDFRAAFGLGEDGLHINASDANGITLAAIQGLNRKLEQKDAQILRMERELAELKRAVHALGAEMILEPIGKP
ncbi:hypothetical protein PDESU_02937 [Pontiella desulfatans]|uniref:Peptidase S74 domain-containing protein n=1 Tax=Pontiella desulfatans TaxID=2750659 RepID=A0A6C2U4Q5_PONDE|nr:tail fiber domain-containing protein [Pontiella desulfatans]VGO14376.1 hypothetical protein PDESU_02937 [Pontiella desulfatans]